ncbi:MAG: HIT family protein [Candidatus Bipolaricaulota bacterium]|nr:HIT family protein [Candidatus Bipolaricaulota bacterium]MDW8126935.1 HIT family protein [Candidatus Bipolaricaulota bacterium]
MSCPFCRIAKGDLSAHILYADELILAFLDASPMAPGHTLVIPRAHIERFTALPEEIAGKLFATAVRVGKALQEALAAHGFTVGLNDGRVAGQGIPHVHLHLVPRFFGDGGGSLHSVLPSCRARIDPELAARIRGLLIPQGS